MKNTIKNQIEEIAKSAILEDIETDRDCGTQWRNGLATAPDGRQIPMGGGWIANEDTANRQNELAGIAGGMRQGVWYPNETLPGAFIPYEYGEDESGWQDEIMPSLLGEDWRENDDADDIARELFQQVQDELERQAK